jgi:hypothetical protein
MTKGIQAGRLALREEGEFWNAYFAPPDTMVGAELLGSLRLSIAKDPKHKAAFMLLMRDAMSDIIEASVGERPHWPVPPRQAPEHERTRRG